LLAPAAIAPVIAETTPSKPAPQPGASFIGEPSQQAAPTNPSSLLSVPVTNLKPGSATPSNPSFPDPRQNLGAVERGMRYFTLFNCVGCHAPNGGGGMGPSLSNASFIYGGQPANLFLTI